MDLPITRPSVMSYADQLDFNELLGKSRSDKFNGFIRVTSGSLEGHILFKEGNQVAASFDKYSKIEAVEKIRSVTEDASTVIEVFDLKLNQLDYLMDINKVYIINLESKADSIRDEIARSAPPKTLEHVPEEKPSPAIPVENTVHETRTEPVKPEEPVIIEGSHDKEEIPTSETINEAVTSEDHLKAVEEESPTVEEEPNNVETNKYYNPPMEESKTNDVAKEPKIGLVEESVANDKFPSKESAGAKTIEEELAEEKSQSGDIKLKNPENDTEDMDRTEIMKKYGLKDVHEEEVETLLESYKGGSLSAEDVEKVELTLMNKIKKSILGIPKVKGAEVIVFLDNSSELLGTINIISEYESKGLISRIMGDSKDIENIKTQIMNLTQIEIRKSFRGYPEIVDNFEINVEFS